MILFFHSFFFFPQGAQCDPIHTLTIIIHMLFVICMQKNKNSNDSLIFTPFFSPQGAQRELEPACIMTKRAALCLRLSSRCTSRPRPPAVPPHQLHQRDRARRQLPLPPLRTMTKISGSKPLVVRSDIRACTPTHAHAHAHAHTRTRTRDTPM